MILVRISKTLYYVSTDENETSENKAYANFLKDWLIKDSKWFVYLQFRYRLGSI